MQSNIELTCSFSPMAAQERRMRSGAPIPVYHTCEGGISEQLMRAVERTKSPDASAPRLQGTRKEIIGFDQGNSR
eukprot:1145153-Pelagomonas_calceolata.AAC.2